MRGAHFYATRRLLPIFHACLVWLYRISCENAGGVYLTDDNHQAMRHLIAKPRRDAHQQRIIPGDGVPVHTVPDVQDTDGLIARLRHHRLLEHEVIVQVVVQLAPRPWRASEGSV